MRLDNKTLSTIDTTLNEDQTTLPNPIYRYWGGLIEEYYLLIWCKYQKAMKESCNCEEGTKKYEKAIEIEIRYSYIFDSLLKKYPHLRLWSKEIIGVGGLKIC